MASSVRQNRYTAAEYYATERVATYKSDYYNGEIYDVSGGTSDHSLIIANLIAVIGRQLREKKCRLFDSNMRMKVTSTGLRTYPDASVYCGSLEYDPDDSENTTLLNPSVIFEVLSPSKERYDRGFKTWNYRQVQSLRAYVMIASNCSEIELCEKGIDGLWTIRDASGLDAVASLAAIGVDLPLSEIYDRVEFPPHVSPRGGNS